MISEERVRSWSVEEHEELYRRYCSAYWCSQGHPEAQHFNRKMMDGILTYGKVTPERAVLIEAQARQNIAGLSEWLDDALTAMKKGAEVPSPPVPIPLSLSNRSIH